jgi:hypothetical protein
MSTRCVPMSGPRTGLVTAMTNSINELKTAFEAYRKQNEARLDSLEQRLGQIESGKPSASRHEDL